MLDIKVLNGDVMKRNHLKLIIIEILMLLMLGYNTFISGKVSTTDTLCLTAWGSVLLILILLMGFAKDKHLYKIDVLQITFIYTGIYFLSIYVFGFFFGFVKSPYSLSKVFENMLPVLILIILQELVRYAITSKGKQNKYVIGLLILFFIAFDISMGIRLYTFNDGLGIYTFVGLLVLPSIANNLLLTYISYKNGYSGPILYRCLFGLTVFIFPFFPDLGPYIESVLGVVFPTLLFLKLNSLLGRDTPTKVKIPRLKKFMFWAPTVTVLTILVILTSGLFKIHAMAVGSGSMTPNINLGDVVIIEKLKDSEIANLKVGDVIAYEYDRKIIIHRIIAIENKDGKYIFHTKGDYNDGPDNYEVKQSSVRGLVRYKIPYIGQPSVWLRDKLG